MSGISLAKCLTDALLIRPAPCNPAMKSCHAVSRCTVLWQRLIGLEWRCSSLWVSANMSCVTCAATVRACLGGRYLIAAAICCANWHHRHEDALHIATCSRATIIKQYSSRACWLAALAAVVEHSRYTVRRCHDNTALPCMSPMDFRSLLQKDRTVP